MFRSKPWTEIAKRARRVGALAVMALAVFLIGAGITGLTRPRIAEAEGPTIIPGGTFTGSVTWTAAGSPYIVQGSVTVADTGQLTIEPGVEVRFGDYVSLQVNGRLVAEGGATAPITFTTASTTTVAPGRWYYIRFASGSSGVMRRCVVNSAGLENYPALWIESSDVVVEDCRIHDNADEGIYLSGGGLAPVLRRVEVDRNGGWAVVQSTLDMNPAYEGLSIHDNGRDAVYVGGYGTTGRDVVLDGGAVGGVPYVLAGNWTVGGGRALTVTAGTAVRFGDYVSLQVNGRLVAEGDGDGADYVYYGEHDDGGAGALVLHSVCEWFFGGDAAVCGELGGS
jgi:hypothetical protein